MELYRTLFIGGVLAVFILVAILCFWAGIGEYISFEERQRAAEVQKETPTSLPVDDLDVNN